MLPRKCICHSKDEIYAQPVICLTVVFAPIDLYYVLLDQHRRVDVFTRALPLHNDHVSTTRRERHRENNIRDTKKVCVHCITLYHNNPVATPICSIVNLVAVRSVLFFDMEVIIWAYICFLAWLPERQFWGTVGICINPRWPQWTPGSHPDGISFN